MHGILFLLATKEIWPFDFSFLTCWLKKITEKLNSEVINDKIIKLIAISLGEYFCNSIYKSICKQRNQSINKQKKKLDELRISVQRRAQ